ncbi:MAG: menaquinone biosynthetic enzyme MqnA/MqnD family protein [bacterium]
MRVAKIPYLNSQPFYGALDGNDAPREADLRARGFETIEMAPAQLGDLAREGRVDAGLIPAADYFALSARTGGARYERLGDFGISVRGRVESVLLLSEKPLAQLGGARIGVTEESATSVRLLRLLLEVAHGVTPAAYVRGARENVDACLLIGDEALAATAANAPAPFVYDLAEEWETWQDLPFVFAVWVARDGVDAAETLRLAALLDASLDGGAHDERVADAAALARTNSRAATVARPPRAHDRVVARIAEEYARGPARHRALGDAARLAAYLGRFTYRLGPDEERALALFRRLLDEHAISYNP